MSKFLKQFKGLKCDYKSLRTFDTKQILRHSSPGCQMCEHFGFTEGHFPNPLSSYPPASSAEL